jgi:hypothetical protein
MERALMGKSLAEMKATMPQRRRTPTKSLKACKPSLPPTIATGTVTSVARCPVLVPNPSDLPS